MQQSPHSQFVYICPLKILFTILSCFLLYLACIPCSDATTCEEKEAVSASTGGEDHEHESETCTPFCICSCCAVTIAFSTDLKAQPFIAGLQKTRFPIHNTDFDTDVFYGIWQPPQLG